MNRAPENDGLNPTEGLQINAATVLRLVRDKIAEDLHSIAKYYEQNRTYSRYIEYDISRILTELADAGIVTLEQSTADLGRAAYHDVENKKVYITPKWPAIQRCLGLSLTKLGQKQADSLEVTPFFGVPDTKMNLPDVFILMSFDPELSFVYRDHILKVTTALNLSAGRADDFFNANHVMADIWRAIWGSKLVVADCTGRNPNVFYEIGVAHTIGKPVILITPTDNDVPFDLRHIRYICYDVRPRGMAEFERRLTLTIKDILQRSEALKS